MLKRPSGLVSQAAAFSGFDSMEFGPGDRVLVSPLRLRCDHADDLEAHLLRREAHAIEALHALKRASARDEGGRCCVGGFSGSWRFEPRPGRQKNAWRTASRILRSSGPPVPRRKQDP